MAQNKKKRLEELMQLAKEPRHNLIEKEAKISDDKKSLLLRVPQEIREKFRIKAGDKIRFSGEIKNGKTSTLKIEWVKT